jgi:aspartate--ammonia ligase
MAGFFIHSKQTIMKSEILKAEESIRLVKQIFESELAHALELTRVSSPIAVLHGTGVNDDLNGIERTVKFPVKSLSDKQAVVVNSLAKWKRIRLKVLEVEQGKGILTDMRAIRPDEDYSAIHSIYVDQWDWEKHISEESRNLEFLKSEVEKIYEAMKKTEDKVANAYDEISAVLPDRITFIHAEDLLKQYPDLSPKEREDKAAYEYGAIFLMGVGGVLSDGKSHDGRAPDYDDWSTETEAGYYGLNGDIIVWHPVLESAFEISSMGIRVDKSALLKQLEIRKENSRISLEFHQLLLRGLLTESIGGGIGQSRLCMFMLRKKHIGEVQVGIWPESIKDLCRREGMFLL